MMEDAGVSWRYGPTLESLNEIANRTSGDVLIVIHWPSRVQLHIKRTEIRSGALNDKQNEYQYRGDY